MLEMATTSIGTLSKRENMGSYVMVNNYFSFVLSIYDKWQAYNLRFNLYYVMYK